MSKYSVIDYKVNGAKFSMSCPTDKANEVKDWLRNNGCVVVSTMVRYR